MRPISCFLGAGLAGLALPVAGQVKPNIVLILIDDMGYRAVSCYGNTLVPTPHIDRIAREGIRFTQGYVSPQSTPSRATLLTGQYTARNRMWHVIPRYGYPYARVQEPGFIEELPREQVTAAEMLKTGSYATACIGKWHLSTWGHDGYYTYLYPGFAHHYGFDYVNPVQSPTEYQSHGDKGVDMLTGEAIGFIEQHRDSPFFVYLAHHTLHNKVLAPEDLVDKYRKAGYADTGLHNATYLAAIEHLDNSVGRLLNRLDELNLAENTIVCFISDNGGVDELFDNHPLRQGKGTVYEGGIRVPFMFRWPARIAAGQVCTEPVHLVDLYPTLAEAAGVPVPREQVLDGTSLLPWLVRSDAVQPPERGPLYFYQPLYDLLWGAVPNAAVIDGGYKLIWFFGDYIDLENGNLYMTGERLELYNLQADIGETTNLAGSMPELAARMKSDLRRWIEQSGAIIPQDNPEYAPERWDELQQGN